MCTSKLLKFTKSLHNETKGTNVKVMQDAKYENKTTQLPFSFKNPCYRESVTSVVSLLLVAQCILVNNALHSDNTRI